MTSSPLMLTEIRVLLLSAAALLAIAATTSCAGFAAKGEAESAVAGFHEMLDAERYGDIYDATDDLFKDATTRSSFMEILQAVHRKMGAVHSTAQKDFYSQDRAGTNAGSYISMRYDTEFAEGHAIESFNWRVVNGKVRLAGYNINSSLLITR
jgi:hypothetical protein